MSSLNLSNGTVIKKKVTLHSKYISYLHNTNNIVFTVLSTINQAYFHLSGTIITQITLFGYVVLQLTHFVGIMHLL